MYVIGRHSNCTKKCVIPWVLNTYDLCECYHSNTLQKFIVVLLRAICSHFEIPVKLRDKRQILIDKLSDVISDCQCVSQ